MYTPTLRQLEYLVAIADIGQFSAAARHCGVSQPALSRQVREVEEGLGVLCFERRHSGSLVTPEGATIIEHARRVLAEARALSLAAGALGDPMQGRLRIGAIPTLAPSLLPHLIRRLGAVLPRIEPVLVEGMTHSLREQLHAGDLDVALIALPYDGGGLAERAWLVEPFVLAVPHGHALDRDEPATIDEVLEHPLLLLSQGHCLREHVMQACRLTEQASVQATSLTTLLLMVQAGLGASLVPAAAAQQLEGVRLRAFEDPPPTRQIGLWWRPGSARVPAIERLGSLIAELPSDLRAPPAMPGPAPVLVPLADRASADPRSAP